MWLHKKTIGYVLTKDFCFWFLDFCCKKKKTTNVQPADLNDYNFPEERI